MSDYADKQRLDRLESTVVAIKGELQRLEDAHAALEAKVERLIGLDKSTVWRIDKLEKRIAALEPPAAPAPDPVCPIPDCNPKSCNRAYCYVTDSVGAGIVPTAEPDPAPLDPVLADFIVAVADYLRNRKSNHLIGELAYGYENQILAFASAYGRDDAR